MRTLAVGDIHGNYLGFKQVLEKANFDYENDELICLGDVADSWPDTDKCFDELMKIKNLVYVIGNHDAWLLKWLNSGLFNRAWVEQGGINSIEAYKNRDDLLEIMAKHRDFIKEKGVYYHVDKRNNLYVHGGFDWHKPIEENDNDLLMWDRHAFEVACSWEAYKITHPTEKPNYFKDYNEVFVGHTATDNDRNWRLGRYNVPMHVANMWNLDQGSGWAGRLSLMDVDTKEYWQSDLSRELYPGEAKIKGIR